VIALGVGYVVGARAGRGRYRQITNLALRVADGLERYAGSGSGGGHMPWSSNAGQPAGRPSSGPSRDRDQSTSGVSDGSSTDQDRDDYGAETAGSSGERPMEDVIFDHLRAPIRSSSESSLPV